ncbi:twin transmembrane helix small protein [Glacieibacterium frigidum]|uniref:Twin transmembrane helix small protein n=1 Tax=Glacieibacterium frigidum TaxID=2593303 RepID=A0A552U915_9SPHN|nr:twin transmembrane helix small protein [Glacieibacterium frigidum]TRW14702.1 twin transmembrane helix small protein [Glacieibacterium frigidum]
MNTALIVLLVIAVILTATMLVRGIITMARGKDITGVQSNKLMSYRVAFQAAAIVIVVILLLIARQQP